MTQAYQSTKNETAFVKIQHLFMMKNTWKIKKRRELPLLEK